MTGMGHQMKQLKHLILMDEDTEVHLWDSRKTVINYKNYFNCYVKW